MPGGYETEHGEHIEEARCPLQYEQEITPKRPSAKEKAGGLSSYQRYESPQIETRPKAFDLSRKTLCQYGSLNPKSTKNLINSWPSRVWRDDCPCHGLLFFLSITLECPCFGTIRDVNPHTLKPTNPQLETVKRVRTPTT